jgi:hypothetical protein|tara:strand:+ start:83 stop:682 length:600 start_codon:yes stop_codon:yes gene_type:complete
MELLQREQANREPPFPRDWTGPKDPRASSKRTIFRRASDAPQYPSSCHHACQCGVPDGFDVEGLEYVHGEVIPDQLCSLRADIQSFSDSHPKDDEQLNFFELLESVASTNGDMTPFDMCFKTATEAQLQNQKDREKAWREQLKDPRNKKEVGLRSEDFTYDDVMESLKRAQACTTQMLAMLKTEDKKGRKQATKSTSSK